VIEYQDALKDRVGAFTESISIMACPVLVAVALMKADLMHEGNSAVRHGVSPLAAISLCLCSVAFILLNIASAFGDDDRLKEYAYYSSKVLVFLCAVSQMLLAFMIFLLISMRFIGFVALLIPFVIALCYSLHLSWTSNEDINRGHNNWDKILEPSLDFSAAVTSLLFLGLEGLALEGQIGVGEDLNSVLPRVLGWVYFFCLAASFVMFLAAVPPISYERMCNVLHYLCGSLSLLITIVVFVIALLLEKEAALVVLCVPCCLLFLYGFLVWEEQNRRPAVNQHQHKPASLELTKVTFAAFLAVSLPSFGDDQISRSTHVFIVSAAMSVVFGLVWRFLTHFNQIAAFQTARAACVATHGCIAVAVISLVFMGMEALADAGDECHIACNHSTHSRKQLDLFATCFVERAREATSYALSSVKCK
jgi:hypothetical protein